MTDSSSLDVRGLLKQHHQEHQTMMEALGSIYSDIERLTQACTHALLHKKKILWFGNGGSASDAQHLATELVVRLCKNRPAIPSLALTTDTSALTAIGNDFGFESLFSRQIEALGQEGDVAIGISTSGHSPNVLQGLACARSLGLVTVGWTGATGGRLHEHSDIILRVPSAQTMRIQEAHIWIGHVLCSAIEKTLYPS